MSLLEVKDLKVYYPVKIKTEKILQTETKYVKAVDGISFSVDRGKTFGLVGESGCGKSTTGKAIVKLLTPTCGSITFEGMTCSIFLKNLISNIKRKSR